MPPKGKFKVLEFTTHVVSIIRFTNDAEQQNKNRILRINAAHLVIATFVDKNNVIAEKRLRYWSLCLHD